MKLLKRNTRWWNRTTVHGLYGVVILLPTPSTWNGNGTVKRAHRTTSRQLGSILSEKAPSKRPLTISVN
jgi:hypothetical protein